jgi:hypothetical protein
MVPRSITKNLASLRRRERLLTFLWGASCWLAIALVLLLLCMFADWLIDRWRDTPIVVRLAFLIAQVSVWTITGFFFVVWPQIRRLPDEKLALWVEDKLRKFDHRLISAVQLNRKDAKVAGMSEELVKIVTREAEKESNRFSFAQIADHARFGFSTALAGSVLLVFLLPIAAFSNVSFILLARQALLDYEIPRTVHLESASVMYWPVGDDIPIRFRVTGEFNPDMVGSVYLSPGGRFDIEFIKEDDGGAIFGADIKPEKLPLTETLRYSARLADGRTKAPSEMQLVPRPVITENRAWVILPAYCDTRPVKEKIRYERQQASGNVIAIPGSAVRIQFETQRPITKAWLELRGIEKIEAKAGDDKPPPITFVDKGKVDMRVVRETRFKGDDKTDVWIAETTFDVKDGVHRYVMKCEDEHGFANVPKSPQSIDIVPEGAPLVSLLKDTFDFGDGSSFDLEGLPVVIGRPIRIPFSCEGPYGLSRARVLYRVLKKHESGNEPAEEPEWTKLELQEYAPKTDLGRFDLKRGVFEKMSFQDQVTYYFLPSPEPDKIIGRTIGGGRYHLKSGGLIDTKGNPIKLKSGDQIEYCVEVFAAEREPKASIPMTRSESRVATIMEEKEFFTWLGQVRQEDERIRQLEKLQKGIFDRN